MNSIQFHKERSCLKLLGTCGTHWQMPKTTKTQRTCIDSSISPRDLTQLFVRAIETPDIEYEHGVPWQVVYGISDNTRTFWSLSNVRQALGYRPEDDSEVKFAADIQRFLLGENATGRVGPI